MMQGYRPPPMMHPGGQRMNDMSRMPGMPGGMPPGGQFPGFPGGSMGGPMPGYPRYFLIMIPSKNYVFLNSDFSISNDFWPNNFFIQSTKS